MNSRNNVFEMINYSKQPQQQNNSLDNIPEKVLPKVMSLLGQYSRPYTNANLPRYSIFYLSPLSTTNLLYNLLYIFVFYLIQIQIPLILGFGQNFLLMEFSNFAFKFCYWLIFAFFLFDVFVSFHKGYYEYGKGKVCDNQNKIITHYLKTQFVFDIIVIAFMIVPQANQNQQVDFLLLFTLLFLWIKKSKYKKQIVNILQYQKGPRIVFILVILFLDVLLLGHFGACIFVGMDIAMWNNQYYGSSTSYYWLSNNNNYAVNLMNAVWYDQYVYAQSFSTGTLSTLAPGPFVKNPIEVSYALFVMIYFMLLASYVGQVLINILYVQEVKRVFHQQNIQDFDKYMTLKSISQTLKTRIYNFFELVYDAQSRMQTQQQKLAINLLPLNLKQELLLEMSFVKIFFMFKYIDDSKSMQKQMALRINRIIVDSGSCLFQQATLIKKRKQQSTLTLNNIYHLSRGMVKFYISLKQPHLYGNISQTSYFNYATNGDQQMIHEQNTRQKNKNYLISMSNSDKFIGLYEFITKKSFHYCCNAIDLCEFDVISRKDFMQILKFTQNQQLYQRLRHQLLTQNNLNIINKVCSICYNDHIQQNCPSINYHYRVVRQLLRGEGNIGKHHDREVKISKKRRNLKSKKIYSKLKRIQIKNNKIQQSNPLAIFSQILESSNIRFEQLLFSITKIDEIQQIYIWKNYYPEDNVDRVNFILPFNISKSYIKRGML